jgi:uncharacterized protein (DUF2252 family)
MSIISATRDYESWVGRQLPLVAHDLDLKHQRMAEAVFPFLRATFYRWVQLWREICPELAATPKLRAVGDLHIENFGTWRDAEGRLVWGINDFDEAGKMPYAIDLVRLATSALLAGRDAGLRIGGAEACAAILGGYTEQIEGGGKPFILEEDHPILRRMALGAERDPVRFWAKMKRLPDCDTAPKKVRALLAAHLPAPDLPFRLTTRIAGLGSLGRPRIVALAPWHDGMVAREAKAMLPSAYGWATGDGDTKIRYMDIVDRAVRCPDPFLALSEGWLVRRLAPHCSRIEIAQYPKSRDEARLLHAMGRETANVHLGTPKSIATVTADLKTRKAGWLHDAAQAMAEATIRDWEIWRGAGAVTLDRKRR